MPGQRCCVCGNSRANEPAVGFHRFPQKNLERRAVWLSVFGKTEDDVTSNSRVCSRHFPGGAATSANQTAVLSTMYLSAVGYGMVFGGIYINSTSDDDVTDQLKDYDNGLKLMFAGGIVTTLFLVCCVLVFIV
ncbi:hypothetical protein GBAR_LOCUS8768 [Geodia barretti]|uniref:THAP-type domain-containing protein n=1 Tax=Geodia barretti TaxID=519541 RepID=A0AA35WGY6_GEOBA|nr:hypothetical protein GBAR_LOCUS8768 [Geodia barretti]